MIILLKDLKLPPHKSLIETKLSENHSSSPSSSPSSTFLSQHAPKSKKSFSSMDVFSVIITLIAGSGSVGLLQVIKNYNKSIPEGRKTVSLMFNFSRACVKLLLQGQNRGGQYVHNWLSGDTNFLLNFCFIEDTGFL